MIKFEMSGSFDKTDTFLRRMLKGDLYSVLDKAGQKGVQALRAATPAETGATAAGWGYQVKKSSSSAEIAWTNSHTVNGLPIVILLQYGHGTGTGGYVKGRDFINPALRPIFDQIAEDVWKVVTSA